MNCISKMEIAVLKEMYPEGCRVELDYMEPQPFCVLEPGDLGTVKFIDDAGRIYVAWDQEEHLGLLFKGDRCRCLMVKEEIQWDLLKLEKTPFVSLKSLREWLEDRLLHVFPKMFIRPPINGELLVELGNEAFMLQKPRISIDFIQDGQNHVHIRECRICDGKMPVKKNKSR